MQLPEDFMRQFFRARTADLKIELERRTPFRKTFFVDDCRWDGREGTIERSESETIFSVSTSAAGVEVITLEINPFPKLRYHLQAAGESWLIRSVDVECPSCSGNKGKSECTICNGNVWLRVEDQLERIKHRKLRIQRNMRPPGYGRF
jgi:hypothetical protein